MDNSVFVTALAYDLCTINNVISYSCVAEIMAHEAVHSHIEFIVEHTSLGGVSSSEFQQAGYTAYEEVIADLVALKMFGGQDLTNINYITAHLNQYTESCLYQGPGCKFTSSTLQGFYEGYGFTIDIDILIELIRD